MALLVVCHSNQKEPVMAKFHGNKNLHLGEPEWASAEWDADARVYVIEVSGDDEKAFRSVAADYGFSEAKASTAEAAPVADEPADEVEAPAKKTAVKKAAPKSE